MATPTTSAQRYYRAHKDAMLQKSAEYMMDDPTGEKKRKAKIANKKCLYKKSPTMKRAMAWFIAVYSPNIPNITIEELQVWTLHNSGVSMILG